MLPIIEFSHQFDKQLKKSPSEIKLAFRTRLETFIENRHNPFLNNHQLSGKFRWHRSINITGDWRAIFRESINEDGKTVLVFVLLGTHCQLYR